MLTSTGVGALLFVYLLPCSWAKMHCHLVRKLSGLFFVLLATLPLLELAHGMCRTGLHVGTNLLATNPLACLHGHVAEVGRGCFSG